MYKGVKLELLDPTDLKDEDIRWMTIGTNRVSFQNYSAADVVRKALSGNMGIYRLSGACSGIVATSIAYDALFIEVLVGRGLIKCFDEIYAELKTLARGMGQTRIAGLVEREGLGRLYEKRLGLRPAAALYIEEL